MVNREVEVDEVREERLRRRERDRLRRQRETNEERQARFVNLCSCLSLITFCYGTAYRFARPSCQSILCDTCLEQFPCIKCTDIHM